MTLRYPMIIPAQNGIFHIIVKEDRKRIDTVMQSYRCENYTLHPDIAQCIETFKK